MHKADSKFRQCQYNTASRMFAQSSTVRLGIIFIKWKDAINTIFVMALNVCRTSSEVYGWMCVNTHDSNLIQHLQRTHVQSCPGTHSHDHLVVLMFYIQVSITKCPKLPLFLTHVPLFFVNSSVNSLDSLLYCHLVLPSIQQNILIQHTTATLV